MIAPVTIDLQQTFALNQPLSPFAVAALKAEGMEYDERMAALDEITWPKPLAELLTVAR